MPEIWQFASYNLLNLFSPAVGQEQFHCDMKRGFTKARKKEPQVKALLEQDNIPQRIGIISQRGVYEFHQDPMMLYRNDAVEKVAEILQLNQESVEIQERVIQILKNYQLNPILLQKNIIELSRGDEGFPKFILIKHGNYQFKFYAAIDCLFKEPDETLHILDFKTGKSDFDRRQAYLYLLAVSYLYPQQKAIASFYNLENGRISESITATPDILKAFQIELAIIAKKHQEDLGRYRNNSADFASIFPPNPGFTCTYCPFTSVCQFSISKEVSV